MAVSLAEVTKLYVATFNRAPDAAGITYWANSGMPIENIAQSFFDQPETQSLYPSGTANSSFVTSVYDNLFNRAPDTDGLNYWVQELDSGSVSKQNFILAVINGAQNTAISQDATILTNKQTVGLDFVAKGLESVDLAQYVMEDIDASTTSVQDAIALIQTIVAPTQQFTAEMVNNLELYRYDEADSENYTTGYDAYLKATFHTDGTATIEKYKAPLGSSTWEMYASYNKSWQLVNNQLVVSGDDNAGDISQTTFTLLSQTQTEWSFLDETIGTDTMGTPETSDDVPYTDAPNISVWLTQEPLIPRSTITIEETNYLQGGFYTQGEGVSANGGVDYDVNVTATAANVSTMLGDLVNTAFIINIHDTTANQAITGTTKNDVFNWRGGNDSFDGSSDGGDWYNGGSDAVSRTVSSPTSTVTFDTSWLNTLRIITGTSTVATILKNNDGSFDIASGNVDTLHLVNTELFRLYVSTETGGEVFTAFNVDIDLTGIQTGSFDAVFI